MAPLGYFGTWSCVWSRSGEKLQIVTTAAGRALVVDDDPDMRRLVRIFLEVEGDMSCDDAEDAFHALELWHAEHHDVVVLDQRMPGVTGIELAEVLLAEDPDQFVVLFSAHVELETVERARALGVRAVLFKDELQRLTEVIGAR